MFPGIPGVELPHDTTVQLRERVQQLCHMSHPRFPGSQPISFSSAHLTQLEKEDFWVCEKSDGIRVLMYICLTGGHHSVFLIDRKNLYRQQQGGFFFPHHADKTMPMRDCILDGELVIEKDPNRGEKLCFLVFDALVIDEENIMDKTLDSRYGRLKTYFFQPYKTMLKDFPNMAAQAPFQLKLKPMELSYHLDTVLAKLPELQHGTDGLIYTAVKSKYIPQTDIGILKWKPPEENSVDFKLELRFPELKTTGQPDFSQMPLFLLYSWEGGRKYSFYDTLTVDEDEWEAMKKSRIQYDDRIIEARWDFDRQAWRLMRIRDDKPDGNHIDVVEKVVKTILDPVSKEDLIARCPNIKSHWKARAGGVRLLPPYNFPVPKLPFPGAPNWQGACVGYGFAKVTGPSVVDDWNL
ncbi:Dcp1p-Dcp2p decapping enzyme complex alpha subunit [Serendipita sp. 401]|nr:Dcp1p-Dcp2p decapping enzyme complex alpha subunit [Serendipita sp. 401]KAG9057484.1 Dcp1p-Dcp2p decapping enzyme complex alpha subunit [Serendipita sp. 407]